jgi:hypothetical protein
MIGGVECLLPVRANDVLWQLGADRYDQHSAVK